MTGFEGSMYVGCSLNGASDEFKQSVEALKGILRHDYDVLDFFGQVGGTPADVYQRDMNECLVPSSFFLAICDHPSTGLGMELQQATGAQNKPTLAVAHRDASVSRMVEGIPASNFEFARYDNLLADVPGMVRNYLQRAGLLQ